jgi:hypothetical protein
MIELFANGRIVEGIVALVALEALALLIWRAKAGSGPEPLSLIANLLAGSFLLLALRNSLAGTSPQWIAICLIAALVAHVADLTARWGGDRRRASAKPSLNATISLKTPKTRDPESKR